LLFARRGGCARLAAFVVVATARRVREDGVRLQHALQALDIDAARRRRIGMQCSCEAPVRRVDLGVRRLGTHVEL
jgi:hypothetical protein